MSSFVITLAAILWLVMLVKALPRPQYDAKTQRQRLFATADNIGSVIWFAALLTAPLVLFATVQ